MRTVAKALTLGRSLDAASAVNGREPKPGKEKEKQLECCFEEFSYEYGVEPTYGLLKHLSRSTKRGNLQLWIPDTIVLGQGKPYWLYSSRSGYLQKTTRFDKSHVLDKLGSRRYKDEHVVVVKRTKSRTQNAVLSRLRNTTTVLTSVGLESLLASEDVYNDKLVIQRFIKCKGSKPAIIRAHWQCQRPFRAWFISSHRRTDQRRNAAKKDDPAAKLVFSLSEKHGSVDVFHLKGKACMETSRQTLLLLAHIQGVLGRRLEELAVDFIRDTSGNLWFLQVKAYKLLTQALKPRLNPADPGITFEKKCRFCMRSLRKEQTRFRLTTQMILDTSALLIKRLPRDTYDRVFGAQAGADLGLDPSKLYHGHRVCEVCYELYQKEKRLAQTASQLCRLMGNRVKLSVDLPETVTALTKQPLERCGFCLQDEVFKQHISKEQKQQSSVKYMSVYRVFIALHEIHKLPELTSFEPESLQGDGNEKRKQKKGNMELVLALEVLGNQIQIDITQNIRRAESRGDRSFVAINQCRLINFFTEEPQDEPLASHRSGVSMLIALQQEVKLKLIELGGESPPWEASSVSQTKEPAAKVIGQCLIPLLQFKSSLVRNSTMLLPMGFSNELCQVRVSLGIQRVHQSLHPNALGRTFCRGGIFQSIEPFHVSAPIPAEWMDALSSTPETVARKLARRQQEEAREEDELREANRGREEEANAVDELGQKAWCLQVELHQLRNLHHQQLSKVHNLYAQYTLAGKSYITQVVPVSRESSSLDFSYVYKHFFVGSRERLHAFLQGLERRLEIRLFTSMDPEEAYTTRLLSQIVMDADETGHHCMTRGEILACFKQWESSLKEGQLEAFELAMMQQVLHNLQDLWQHAERRSCLSESMILDELLHLCLILRRLHQLCLEEQTSLQAALIREAPRVFFPSHRSSYEPELSVHYEKQKDRFTKAICSINPAESLESQVFDDRWQTVLGALQDVQKLHSADVHANDRYEPNHMLRVLDSLDNSSRLVYKFTISLAAFLQGQTCIDVTYQVAKVKEKKGKHETLKSMVQGMNDTRRRLIWEYVFRSAEESADGAALTSDLMYTLEELLSGSQDKRWFMSEDECQTMIQTLETIAKTGKDKVTIPELLSASSSKQDNPASKLKQRVAALKWKAAVFPTYIASKLSLYPTKTSDTSTVVQLHGNASDVA